MNYWPVVGLGVAVVALIAIVLRAVGFPRSLSRTHNALRDNRAPRETDAFVGNRRVVTRTWRTNGVEHWLRIWYGPDGGIEHTEGGSTVPPSLDLGNLSGGGTPPTDEEKAAKAKASAR